MKQVRNYADDRQIIGCIFCGGSTETRDHVPSRVFLSKPYPENLPVIGCCKKCNQGFSADEQYLACLLEAVIVGSTDPQKFCRSSVSRTLQKAPALRARIETARKEIHGQTLFEIEPDRIRNVILKLARGHAAFELNQLCMHKPNHYWSGPLNLLEEDAHNLFHEAHVQNFFPEVGSRGLQRMLATKINLQPHTGDDISMNLIINDWVDVQEGNYRYLAIDDISGITIRIVIFEYLACEVWWNK